MITVSDADLTGVARLLALYDTARRVPVNALPNLSELPSLPPDPRVAEGAMYALDTLRTWCAQLQLGTRHLSNDPRDRLLLTPREIAQERLRFTADLAYAQQLGFYG